MLYMLELCTECKHGGQLGRRPGLLSKQKRDKAEQIDDEARLFWGWIAIITFDVFAGDNLTLSVPRTYL